MWQLKPITTLYIYNIVRLDILLVGVGNHVSVDNFGVVERLCSLLIGLLWLDQLEVEMQLGFLSVSFSVWMLFLSCGDRQGKRQMSIRISPSTVSSDTSLLLNISVILVKFF